jgi:FkbH-like protein
MLKILDLIKENNRFRNSSNAREILYLSNQSLILFDEILLYNLRLLGLFDKVKTGLFNSIVAEIMNISSECEAIVVNYDPFALMLDSNHYLREISSMELQNLEDNYFRLINQVINNLPPGKPVLFIGLIMPKLKNKNLSERIKKTVDNCNNFLESLISNKVKILSLQKLIKILGADRGFKQESSNLDPSPYTIDFVKILAEIVASMLANQLLNYKKLLVLDCDNTIWGGVAAEEGFEAVEISGSSESVGIFLELQRKFNALNRRGVVLALCSKNNEADVVKVFKDNTDMIMNLEQFASIKINWKPKSQNILEICRELNLSPESVIFVDDSLFEIHEVMSSQQGIGCIQTPRSSIEKEIFEWKLDELFASKITTSEDINRSKYYDDERIRKQQLGKYLSYDDYLRSLNTQIELIRLSDSNLVERVSQLSLKTNQFNFMYARLEPEDVTLMLSDKRYSIFTGSVSDNIGDAGVTFLLITEAISGHPKEIRIIEMVLSCRVFGRNIAERAFMYLIGHFKKLGINKVLCGFEQTAKNSQFIEFLPSRGFILNTVKNSRYEYELDLSEYDPTCYDYPKIVANF